MNRKIYNLTLLAVLQELIETYPDQRFGQILGNYAFVTPNASDAAWDEYYLESKELLERVSKAVETLEVESK